MKQSIGIRPEIRREDYLPRRTQSPRFAAMGWDRKESWPQSIIAAIGILVFIGVVVVVL